MLKVELNRGFVKKLKVEGSTIQIAGEVGTLITSIYRNLGDSESKNGFKMMVKKRPKKHG